MIEPGGDEEPKAAAAPAVAGAEKRSGEPSLRAIVAVQGFDVLGKVLGGAFDRVTLGVLIVCSMLAYVVWIALLPASDRAAHGPDQVLRAMGHLLENNLFAWGGWALAAVTIGASFVTVRALLRRVRSQGIALREIRTTKDPGRLSSDNPLVKEAVDGVVKEAPLKLTAKSDGKQLGLDYSPGREKTRKEE